MEESSEKSTTADKMTAEQMNAACAPKLLAKPPNTEAEKGNARTRNIRYVEWTRPIYSDGISS